MENTLIKFSDRKDGEVPWKLKKKIQKCQLKIRLQNCKKMRRDKK